MKRHHSWLFALFSLGCAEDIPKEEGGSGAEQETGLEDTGGPLPCVENVGAEVPPDAEWLSFDGNSTSTVSLANDVLSSEWVGSYGTYDLNAAHVQGANGFKLDRPGQVVGVSVRWANLPVEEGAATVHLWPDFGSDGYMWDAENPVRSLTQCLDSGLDGEWVEYALEEPLVLTQAFHVFAGYEAQEDADVPGILWEDFWYEGDPPYAGIRFFGVEDELYYLGMAQNWYTWQIRLAVIYDEDIPAADKPWQVDDAHGGAGRMAWGDYDNDGDDDLMVSGPSLFRNEGDGSFSDVSGEAFLDGGSTGGGVWGDYNNDGCLDFFGKGDGYTQGELLLHNNCDGTFSNVTDIAGIHDLQSERDCDGNGEEENSPTEGVAWFDLDSDGLLDLYLANYECSSEHDYFKNYDDFVWRNNGDGTFSDHTESADINQSNQAGRGVTTGDPDMDGDIDVFVSNYRLDKNFFYRNEGDGTLKEIAGSNGTRGVLYSGAYGHTIGAVFGDIDGDGDVDMVHANLAHPFFFHFSDTSMVLVNDGEGNFTDEADARGLYYRETHSNPVLFDADNDGDLDLFITSTYGGRDSDFYENDGTGHFNLANHASGLVTQGSWGAAVADYDQDGDVDLLTNRLFRNETDNEHHWLKVRLVGGAPDAGLSNRSAIGATVRLASATTAQLRQVSGGSGTSVQDSFVQHFGLGADEQVDALDVLFPGGAEVQLTDVDVDQKVWIHEDGRTAFGAAPPEWYPGVELETIAD